ncbi:hypothetical protein GYMLUDRAFT_831264, partial [Collybiopsis luxurians FD-317 M1]
CLLIPLLFCYFCSIVVSAIGFLSFLLFITLSPFQVKDNWIFKSYVYAGCTLHLLHSCLKMSDAGLRPVSL